MKNNNNAKKTVIHFTKNIAFTSVNKLKACTGKLYKNIKNSHHFIGLENFEKNQMNFWIYLYQQSDFFLYK